jgi:hypothetical protein
MLKWSSFKNDTKKIAYSLVEQIITVLLNSNRSARRLNPINQLSATGVMLSAM